jgi:hypothetical protein
MIVLSLGAGVQSSALLVMAARGELDAMPDFAVFSDTGWEPKAVYEHLDRLEKDFNHIIPIVRVSVGNIREDTLSGRLPRNLATSEGRRFATMPFHLWTGPNTKGMLRRQCTEEYKLKPLRRWLRAKMKERGEKVCTMLIGISRDESHRIKTSSLRYITNEYPLVDRGLKRSDCERILQEAGYAAVKSACIGCPFKDAKRWRDTDPDDMREAIEFDAAIRNLPRIKGDVYLHPSLKPLSEVDFRSAEDHGQRTMFGDQFGNECEGMCGV